MAAAAHLGTVHHEDEHHHGPPEANRSSRVDPATLGMMLFIISEIMVFGAFFTAYFFIRVVGGAEWPAEGDHLPKLIAGFNTAILVSSSFTLHYAQEAIRKDNRLGLQLGMVGLVRALRQREAAAEPPEAADPVVGLRTESPNRSRSVAGRPSSLKGVS